MSDFSLIYDLAKKQEDYEMLELIKSKWPDILKTLLENYSVNEISYTTWLKPLEVYSVNNNLITFLVSDEKIGKLGIEMIKKRFYYPIKGTIQEYFETEYEVNFILPSEIDNNTISSISKNDPQLEKIKSQSNLNSKYTFDNFIVGPNNNFAYSSSLAVAESPSEAYNPLFIYGGSGLGKTHLMHAIGIHLLEKNPNLNVLYVSSEMFTTELIKAIGEQKMGEYNSFHPSVHRSSPE